MTSTVAVAMATFNGERYLGEQLRSIAQQSRVPDAMVVHDDGSSDSTLPTLRSFAASATFPVRIIERTQTAAADRYTRIAASFSSAMAGCRPYDFIALADQDDRWHSNRLSVTVAALESHTAGLLAFGDGAYFDEHGGAVAGSLRTSYPVPPGLDGMPAVDQFTAVIARPMVTGAAATLRSSLLDWAIPVPSYWLHDRWLSIAAAAFGGLLPVADRVLDYRVHGSQVVGTGEGGGLGQRVSRALFRHGSMVALTRRTVAFHRRLRDLPLERDVARALSDPVLMARVLLKG